LVWAAHALVFRYLTPLSIVWKPTTKSSMTR
jgi:hypothetical protein